MPCALVPWGSWRFPHLNKGFSGFLCDLKSAETFYCVLLLFIFLRYGAFVVKALCSQVFPEEQFLEAAVDAAEVVWNRGLLKRVGICHGISGNAYTFLSLYRLTKKKEYLYRAKAFACFLLDRAIKLIAEGIMHSGDEPYSLFEGQAGMAYLFLDIINPLESGFPAYEL